MRYPWAGNSTSGFPHRNKKEFPVISVFMQKTKIEKKQFKRQRSMTYMIIVKILEFSELRLKLPVRNQENKSKC